MSIMRNTFLAALAAGTIGTAALATDYTALRADTYINERLLIASKAWIIAEECPDLKPNKLAALPQLLKMQSQGRALGYSMSELSAYVDSPVEQDRFRKIAEPWLEEQGAKKGDPESYCEVGRAQMENRTSVGKLLRGG